MNQKSEKLNITPVKSCPLSPGAAPTTMAKGTFVKLCTKKQGEMMQNGYPKNEYCFYVCKGRDIPKSIVFKNIAAEEKGEKPVEDQVDDTKKTVDDLRKCQVCGEKKMNCTEKYGVEVCTNCVSLLIHAKYRPHALVTAMQKVGTYDCPDKGNNDLTAANKEIERLKTGIEKITKKLGESKKNGKTYHDDVNRETVLSALRISDEDIKNLKQKVKDLEEENATLETKLDNSVETSRIASIKINTLQGQIDGCRKSVQAHLNVIAKYKERGDLAFMLAEGVSDETLNVSKITISKVKEALS